MDFDGSFRLLGTFDPEPLRKRVVELPDSVWQEPGNQLRGGVFKEHTRTIFLVPDYHRFHERTPEPGPLWAGFEAEVAPLLAEVKRAFGNRGYLHRMALTRIDAGGSIPLHTAVAERLAFTHRVHTALVTSEQATITVAGERRHLPPGEIWEINNFRKHDVHNGGSEARIHLMVDWVTPDGLRRWRRKQRRDGLRARAETAADTLVQRARRGRREALKLAWRLRAALSGRSRRNRDG